MIELSMPEDLLASVKRGTSSRRNQARSPSTIQGCRITIVPALLINTLIYWYGRVERQMRSARCSITECWFVLLLLGVTDCRLWDSDRLWVAGELDYLASYSSGYSRLEEFPADPKGQRLHQVKLLPLIERSMKSVNCFMLRRMAILSSRGL